MLKSFLDENTVIVCVCVCVRGVCVILKVCS